MASNPWAAFGTLPGRDDEISVQNSIPRALSYLTERNQTRFRKKFSEQSGDDHQAMHTFRELLVGVFMARQGFMPHYEPTIDGLTPDWHVQPDSQGEFIADVVNFHVENKIETQLDRALDQGQTWSGEIPDQLQRLWSSLNNKAGIYKNLVAKKSLPYVVFVFGWMNTIIQSQQVEECLRPTDGLFNDYETLSGVYHIRENTFKIPAEAIRMGTQVMIVPKENLFGLRDTKAGYCFDYYANPKASCPACWLKNGALPYRFPACSDQPRAPK